MKDSKGIMHPALITIANKIGVKFADRCSFQTYMYDGKTIAMHYTSAHSYYPRHHVPIYFNDHVLLHELGHYVAADKNQRKCPEFGLALVARDEFGEGFSGKSTRKERCGFVERKEGIIQDFTAILLEIYWTEKFNIPLHRIIYDLSRKEISPSDLWYVLNKHIRYHDFELWQALIRFRNLVEGQNL